MMKQFMHVGVPTDKIMEGAVYAEAIKTYIVAPETNEFNIEYLRFEKDTPLPKELQTMVHVAYKQILLLLSPGLPMKIPALLLL